MSTYKLTYFNGMGRAEVTRLLFALGNVEYEDNRLEFAKFKDLKPNTPFGSLPILEVDGQVICQSHAIEYFIAKKIGRAGKDLKEESHALMIVMCIEDVFSPLPETMTVDKTKKEEMRTAYCKEKLPAGLQKLEKLLEGKESGLFIGDNITWPDIALYQFLNGIQKYDYMDVKTEEYPNIQKLMKKVEEDPKIKEWVQKRPQTVF